MNDYDRTKHLELISKAIERMGKASFSLKALTPAAIGVALILIERGVPAWLTLSAAALAVLVYWYLDAQYLGRERSFRLLYDRVRRGELDNDPYVMDIGEIYGKQGVWKCMVTSVTLGVHGSALILIVIAFISLSLRK
jgi:hypothetical protein